MKKTALDVYESEVARLRGGKPGAVGLSVKDESRRLKDSANLAIGAAHSRDALKAVAQAICDDPKRLANFKVAAESRDPVLLAAVAGPRAMANLSGVAVAEGRGKSTLLEQFAADAARGHMQLAVKNPALAARREAQWQGQRNVMARGFMAGAVREVNDTYVKSVSQTISAASGGRAAVSPVPGWRPAGAFRSMSTLSPQLAAARTPVQAVSRVPNEFRDNPALNRSRARAVLAAQLADSRAGVAGAGVGFRVAFRKYYAASRNVMSRAGDRVGAGLDATIAKAGKGRDAVVAGGRAVRHGAAAGGRAVRGGAAAGGRAVRDGAAAGGRAVRDGAAAGVRAVRAGAVAGGRAVEAVDRFFKKIDRKVEAVVVGGATAVRTGVVNLASRAAVRVAATIDRASRLVTVNPMSTDRFKKQLKSHMRQGPEATKSFLEKTLRSASGRNIAMKVGLDPLTISAAAGPRRLAQEMTGLYSLPHYDVNVWTGSDAKSAPGQRHTTLGLSTPSPAAPRSEPDPLMQFAGIVDFRARLIDKRLPTAVPPGGTGSGRDAVGSLQADPEFRELREELCARSVGYSGAGDCRDTNFSAQYEKAVKLRRDNVDLCAQGENRLVTDPDHPNIEVFRDVEARLDSIIEGGRNAKVLRESNAVDFDKDRRVAVAVLDDDWTAGRDESGLEPVKGPDPRAHGPSSVERHYAAERISDLRLDLSPAAQADARENGLENVKPKSAADKVVLYEIEACRDTIAQYERARGNPDYARVAVPEPAAPEAPAQARAEDREAGQAPAPAAAAKPAPDKPVEQQPVAAEPAAREVVDKPAESVPAPASPSAGSRDAGPAVGAPEAAPAPPAESKPAPVVVTPTPAAAAAQSRSGAVGAPVQVAPAAKPGPAKAVVARAPGGGTGPAVPDRMVERKLASAIVLRVAGKERRAANVIKQVVRSHGDQFGTDAARQQACRGAEDHARVVLKGRKVPAGANLSLDPSKLVVAAPARSAAGRSDRTAPAAPAGGRKPRDSRGASAKSAKPVKPAKRSPAGAPSAPGAAKAAGSGRGVGSAARGSDDTPSFAPPNIGAMKRGGTSDRAPVARPSVAVSATPARKDKAQERASDSAQRS